MKKTQVKQMVKRFLEDLIGHVFALGAAFLLLGGLALAVLKILC